MKIRAQAMFIVFLVTVSGAAAAGELADQFKRVSGAVVIIGTQQTMLLSSSQGLQRTSAESLGSGVLISRDGRSEGCRLLAMHHESLPRRTLPGPADLDASRAQM